jgi:hypothetical protein
MQCPACAAELRLVERVPEALYDQYAYVRCPKCAREMVASMPHDDACEPRLMTTREAFRERKAAIAKRNDREGTLAKGMLRLGVVGTWGLAVLAGLGTVPAATVGAVVAAGLGASGMLYGGWVLDNVLGAERWLQTLPHVELAFAALPAGYRA